MNLVIWYTQACQNVCAAAAMRCRVTMTIRPPRAKRAHVVVLVSSSTDCWVQCRHRRHHPRHQRFRRRLVFWTVPPKHQACRSLTLRARRPSHKQPELGRGSRLKSMGPNIYEGCTILCILGRFSVCLGWVPMLEKATRNDPKKSL